MIMKARYIQRGDSIDYTPTTDVTAGDVVRFGSLVGVAKLDIPANTLGALALTGVYELAVKTGKTFTAGAPVFYDSTDGTATTDAPENEDSPIWFFGHTLADVKSGDSTVLARLMTINY